ncbi:Ni/Fe hydrogenase [Romboutsia maritimum]|uniref:Ni/Fe hydrogenase n=1 Tax=Romboutsia maritimum TaxID=2020948 RepID=A0A371IRP1_9FIRM|nr:nickel-dependent hydrogenase large subunit [Romboutsia maritimum]RDY23134.1 Ni/Fe hydrogenase [Romboutsia maritimum]
MTKISIDPVTRISGLLEIEVEIQNNEIVDAKSSGMQFRGFEEMFKGRPPLDIVRLTPRICGICSTHHATVSSKALENALNIIPDPNGNLIRELTNGFEFLQNHLRHIYQFVFPDYVELKDINPLYKDGDREKFDYRLPKNINSVIASHYIDSIEYSRLAHKAIAILSGKAPHCHGIFVGGTTTNLDIQKYQEIKSILYKIKNFIQTSLMPDIFTITKYYEEYFDIGRGYGNLMSTDLFYDENMPVKYSKGGVLINGNIENLDANNITENVKYTWEISNDNKEDAYTWVNAARYNGYAMEVGPLARMIIGGHYKDSISVMDRLVARVLESEKICESLEGLLQIIRLQKAYQIQIQIPESASGMALISASRGVLGHWIEIENKVIKNYTVITPSVWNLSPKDNKGIRGPVEQALVGTKIDDIRKAPTIIGRIVRSFDPCLNCAAHIISDKYSNFTIKIV